MNETARPSGFTLVELVITISLLGITAVSLSILFGGTVSGYLDAASRQDSAAVARLALDRMSRELREAMPQSIRISGSCLQFLPIAAASVYTELNPNTTAVPVVDFTPPAAGTYYLAVHPVNPGQLYGATAMRQIADFGAAGGGLRTLSLTAAISYPQSSPARRAYVLGRPVSFCREAGGALRRYVSDPAAVQPTPGAGLAGGALLASQLDDADPSPAFTHTLGTTRANALVTMNLSLSQRGETLRLNHETRLRNVP
ncbi:MAG: type II secretion system protein [Gammaproteobacteria bacterium]|nr:type II secretion system protein [Gammaproteobacteria bacterium]